MKLMADNYEDDKASNSDQTNHKPSPDQVSQSEYTLQNHFFFILYFFNRVYRLIILGVSDLNKPLTLNISPMPFMLRIWIIP